MHSPSVMPGCTPYVRTEAELRQFLDRVKGYCDYFFGDVNGVASTPEAFRASLDGVERAHAEQEQGT
jgi:hypothetical protein